MVTALVFLYYSCWNKLPSTWRLGATQIYILHFQNLESCNQDWRLHSFCLFQCLQANCIPQPFPATTSALWCSCLLLILLIETHGNTPDTRPPRFKIIFLFQDLQCPHNNKVPFTTWGSIQVHDKDINLELRRTSFCLPKHCLDFTIWRFNLNP